MPLPEQHTAQSYENIMEPLVHAEIEKQLRFYPKNLKAYINKVEVATYALNRLPALYASSRQGKEQQHRIAQRKYKEEITSAVRRAIAAIEKDPLRNSEPIVSDLEVQTEEAKQALQKVQSLLRDRQLLDYDTQSVTWENLPNLLQRALNKLEWMKPTPAESSPALDPRATIRQGYVQEPPTPRNYGLDKGTLW